MQTQLFVCFLRLVSFYWRSTTICSRRHSLRCVDKVCCCTKLRFLVVKTRSNLHGKRQMRISSRTSTLRQSTENVATGNDLNFRAQKIVCKQASRKMFLIFCTIVGSANSTRFVDRMESNYLSNWNKWIEIGNASKRDGNTEKGVWFKQSRVKHANILLLIKIYTCIYFFFYVSNWISVNIFV